MWERLNSLDREKQKRNFGVEITSRRGGVIVIVGPMVITRKDPRSLGRRHSIGVAANGRTDQEEEDKEWRAS